MTPRRFQWQALGILAMAVSGWGQQSAEPGSAARDTVLEAKIQKLRLHREARKRMQDTGAPTDTTTLHPTPNEKEKP